MRLMRNLMNALLLGAAASSLAVAADRDGEYRLNELQSTDAGYREAWQNLVEDESRLPDWVMNLSGTATPMHAVDDQGDKYLVGGLCEKSDCKGQRLLVAFRLGQEPCLRALRAGARRAAAGQVAEQARQLPLAGQAGAGGTEDPRRTTQGRSELVLRRNGLA